MTDPAQLDALLDRLSAEADRYFAAIEREQAASLLREAFTRWGEPRHYDSRHTAERRRTRYSGTP
jgi:hypothetical protein